MTALHIFAELIRLGVRLEAHDDGRLRYSPQQVVPPSLVEEMKAHKAELLAYVRIWGACHLVDCGKGETLDPDEVQPCPKCGSLELWETLAGTWRCQHCDRDTFQRSRELADIAARLRRRERPSLLHRQRQTGPARASPAKVVERDEGKEASLMRQGMLFAY